MAQILAKDVCAVVLAGGMGSRMGGVDKGLQILRGKALANHAIDRLQQQTAGSPGLIAINANRNVGSYAAWGFPVWQDALEGFAGPLAGFATAMAHCAPSALPYLLTVPCDSPVFPLDLLERLSHALASNKADIAVASAEETNKQGETGVRTQPVFCLMRTALAPSLHHFLSQGGRKVDAWTSQHQTVEVAFNLPHDDPQAFFNANTLAQLQSLENP
ncbi:MAG: molybdenum cofactor guanylyltransferase [Sulfuritalea sp.]|nr:molybdenum cofactor guanylyltransferase [Sulfuritalea sp.]